jgi:hypothetical protein
MSEHQVMLWVISIYIILSLQINPCYYLYLLIYKHKILYKTAKRII